MIPAFLIFIWGLPTFHWMATTSIFLIICSAIGFKDYFIWPRLSINSIKTKVSILIYKSLWGFIIYSKIWRIYGRNFITSLWQFLTIVSNLKRSFDVLDQLIYSLLEIILLKIGSISFLCSSATLLKPDFLARASMRLEAFALA